MQDVLAAVEGFASAGEDPAVMLRTAIRERTVEAARLRTEIGELNALLGRYRAGAAK